eukprot:GFKZ01016141.1.p1 GENE.GFKZ01016141.1~~GFKZ01016141.1.p1  ORF type:complete len:436 (-),score=56.95 GFKZ01016141.1:60-1367(-)
MDSNPLHPLIIPLHGSSTHYPWGSPGSTSHAARLQTLNTSAPIHPTKPYSQFIISTHPSHTPARLASTPPISLREHVDSQVIEVDPAMVDFYTRLHAHGIPYIIKLASVASPQPLRVNPTDIDVKHLASQTPNHKCDQIAKAVMIVAIADVDMLFGFQSASHIVAELSRVPECADAVGRPDIDRFVHLVKTTTVKPSDIRAIFEKLMLRKRDFVKKCLEATVDRFLKMPEQVITESDRLLIALHKRFPDDPACFTVYFLNRVMLDAGNAVFVHPQEPHTVLAGDFLEASTFSESFVRAGLTNEDVDVENFLDCLSYDDSPVDISEGERFSDYGVSYVPPVAQFQLLQFKLPKGFSQQMVQTIAPSVILVLDGEGFIKVDKRDLLLPLRAGSVYYLNPQTQFLVTARENPDSLLHFIQIGVNESAAPSTSSSCVVM